MAIPLPSVESLAHRARLASLVSQLRPTRIPAPLTRLPAHRLPTLWTLYRGIMRDSPTETIRSHMRAFFRHRKGIRAQGNVTRALKTAHKWWDIFRKAKEGDAHFQAVCARYSRMIEGAHVQCQMDKVYAEEQAWHEKMRNRAIMTGAYLRPTLFNGPLPRLKPQPIHITGMITARRKARERRIARWETLQEQLNLMNIEAQFERELASKAAADGQRFESTFAEHFSAWREPVKQMMDSMQESFEREKARLLSPYPPEMLEAIKEARREKIRNKTREKERERRGELTNHLIKQMRKGPPPHVLALMSDKKRRLDKIARGASEVGYVGRVKRKLGYRLRDPEAWKVELGKPENKEELDRMAKEIEEENVRRRAALEVALEE